MQALDHAAGYLLAFGINAALCKTVTVPSILFFELVIETDWSYRKEVHGKFACPSQPLDSGSAH
jgi:hypothetical protein